MRTSQVVELGNWVLRVSRPQGAGPHPVLFMLHGWKGDEDVMWIFAQRAPENFLLVAPRAPLTAPERGYSWVDRKTEALSHAWEFDDSVRALFELQISLPERIEADWDSVHLMGFSQGAALCYARTFARPSDIRSVAGLAGFVPGGIEAKYPPKALAGIPIFAAHGSQDETVPVEEMRSGIRILEAAGANVTYCEDRTGHKLSTDCLRALGSFYAGLQNA